MSAARYPRFRVLHGATEILKHRHLEMWRKDGDLIGTFMIKGYRDIDGTPQQTIKIDVQMTEGGSWIPLMYGYLDTEGKPVEGKFEKHFLWVGRDYGQDLANKTLRKSYPLMTVPALMTQMLTDTGCELTLLNLLTDPPTIAWAGKGDFLNEQFSKILSNADVSAYIDAGAKILTIFQAVGATITLKAQPGATDNNIIAPIKRFPFDNIELRNYLILWGKKLDDGWSEGNASDFNKATGNIVSDETSIKRVGAMSIKCAKGTGTEPILKLVFPKYNYDTLDLTKTGSSEMSFWIYIDGPSNTNYFVNVILKDDYNREIQYTHFVAIPPNTWSRVTIPIGLESMIDNIAKGENRWRQISGSTFNWNVKEIWWYLDSGPQVTAFYLDGLELPVRMVAIAQDAGSQTQYKVRKIEQEAPDIEAQILLEKEAVSLLAKRKALFSRISVTAKGEAGIIGNACYWLPGYNVGFDMPADEAIPISKIISVHHIINDDAPSGFRWIVEIDAVTSTEKVDLFRWGFSGGEPVTKLLQALHEEIRHLKRERESMKDALPTFPKPLAFDQSNIYFFAEWLSRTQNQTNPFYLGLDTNVWFTYGIIGTMLVDYTPALYLKITDSISESMWTSQRTWQPQTDRDYILASNWKLGTLGTNKQHTKVGLFDIAGEISFNYGGLESKGDGKLYAVCRAGSYYTQVEITGVDLTKYHDSMIHINGAKCKFYIDGELRAEITTNILTTADIPLCAKIETVTGGSGDRYLYVKTHTIGVVR